MSKRRNRRGRGGHQGEKDSSERWLITYSDLITLLMIFFVIMYAMSKVDVAKFETLTKSLAAALNHSQEIPLKNLGKTGLVVPANPTDNGDKTQHPVVHTTVSSQTQTTDNQALDNLFHKVSAYIQAHHLKGNVEIVNETRGVQITLRDVVLFDTGSATIKPQAQDLLKGLAPFFQTMNNPVVIEGYTDNVPISTSEYPSNWELSSARATSVVRYLISDGVAPERLSAVGYGKYHPVVKNDTTAHRAMNRRINIVILRNATNAQIPTSGNATAGAGTAGSTGSAAGNTANSTN